MSMQPKKFALIGGSTMLAMGLAAFIPQLNTPPRKAKLPRLKVDTSYGKFLGVFPLNVFNKTALVLFGAAGILASRARTENAARIYARAVALAMGPLAILGVIPKTKTLFGMWPLFGAEAAAHGTFAALGARAGFANGHARN
jgi:hypothetical protein